MRTRTDTDLVRPMGLTRGLPFESLLVEDRRSSDSSLPRRRGSMDVAAGLLRSGVMSLGAELSPAGELLFFAGAKKSNQKKAPFS